MKLVGNRVGAHSVKALLLSIVVMIVTLGSSLLLVLCWTLLQAKRQSVTCGISENFSYVIPGKQLVNGQPDQDFVARLQHVLKLWQQSPADICLLGGNRNEAGTTEALVARDWLLEQGLPLSRMLLEQRSESTLENLSFLQALVNEQQTLVLVSSRYHLFRLGIMAESLSMDIRLVASEQAMDWSLSGWVRWIKEAVYIHWFCVARVLPN